MGTPYTFVARQVPSTLSLLLGCYVVACRAQPGTCKCDIPLARGRWVLGTALTGLAGLPVALANCEGAAPMQV